MTSCPSTRPHDQRRSCNAAWAGGAPQVCHGYDGYMMAMMAMIFMMAMMVMMAMMAMMAMII